MPKIKSKVPSVRVMIDKERRVRYTWQSIARYEEMTGGPVQAILQRAIGAKTLTAIYWAGQLHSEPRLTIKQAEDRLAIFVAEGGDTDELAATLLKAMCEAGVLGKKLKDAFVEKPDEDEDESGEGSGEEEGED